MNFTNKEIELAKQLRNSGLLWKPEQGDWFYVIKDSETGKKIEDWWLCCDINGLGQSSAVITEQTFYSWNDTGKGG